MGAQGGKVYMTNQSDVVVIGGGIIGTFIAYELSKNGIDVTVLERGRTGAEASSASAGLLVPLNVVERGESVEVFRLAKAGLDMFTEIAPELEEISGINFGDESKGVLRVAVNEEDKSDISSLADQGDLLGMNVTRMNGDEVRKLEPHFSPNIKAGIIVNDEGTVHPGRLVDAVKRSAVTCGVRFEEGCLATGIVHKGQKITGVQTNNGDYVTNDVIIAAGAWSRICGEWFGFNVPIGPVKGQMLSLRPSALFLSHPVMSSQGGLFPKKDGTIHVGATHEHAGFDKTNTPEGIIHILRAVSALIPALSNAPIENFWSGLRPWCDDYLPVIGPIPGWEGATIAAGHYRMGIVCSPITAKVVHELIVDNSPNELIRPFSPERFCGA